MSGFLQIYAAHLRFRIARPRRHTGWHRLGNASEIVWGQLYGERPHVLFEVGSPLGAGDGDDILPLREQPGQDQLCGGGMVRSGHFLEAVHG